MPVNEVRTPPRFVPTLTDVVPDVPAVPFSSPVEVDNSVECAAASQAPAKGAAEHMQQTPAQQPGGAHDAIPAHDMSSVALALQAKVMARLDDALEERMRYALADIVQLHTQALHQAIRQDIEQLVGAAVHEAIAQELAQMRKPMKP